MPRGRANDERTIALPSAPANRYGEATDSFVRSGDIPRPTRLLETLIDARRFDPLTRSLTTTGTRRNLLEGLASLPALGGLVSLGSDAASARERHARAPSP